MSIERIREALAAGPMPGPWFAGGPGGYCVYDKRCWTNPDGSRGGETPNMVVVVAPEDNTATADFIAACNPAAIRELLAERDALKLAVDAARILLAERDALKVENEKLLALERDVLSTLPGVYYMDPPDGGSAPLGEQVRRMAVDAARYRWLRGEHKRVDPICAVIWKRNGDRNGSEWVNTANIDAAMDAAMEASNEN